MRLLIAMMKHETNTFSPVPTVKEASRSRTRLPISMVSEDPAIMVPGRGAAPVVPG